ncbi:wd repeat-containing protein hypothetical protein [Limosa lapponica baueri]|uniref:Uncharacterized protein n=1 Tax=Limosa lapponica baueri TaxID=1758121 RepID=A0A2I0UDT7_LIMLA|nr:wd repeat-containing protein hypothetical protein [Limosa lapponica baueri]
MMSATEVINKDIKQDWPQNRALRDTTGDRLPTEFQPINHNSLGMAIQPVFYPVKSTLVYAMIHQLLQENTVGDGVKGLTKVQVDNVYSLPLIKKAGHMVIERDQVG